MGRIYLRESIANSVHDRDDQESRDHSREPVRSEEHTSELQSHVNLVCRLLLEKKNETSSKGGRSFPTEVGWSLFATTTPRSPTRRVLIALAGAACLSLFVFPPRLIGVVGSGVL